MREASEANRPWVDVVRAELGWLCEDGYEEVAYSDFGFGFSIDYASANGRVSVAIELGRGDEVLVWLAPPHRTDARAPIDPLRSRRVMMESVLQTRGHALPSAALRGKTPEQRRESLTRHLGALKHLRCTELAGDWSLYRVAVEVGRSGREAAFDYWLSRARVDDPVLATVLERLRPVRRPD